MRLQDDKELVNEVSKAIHLEEWCPERSLCSGTSGSSDAHARAALRAVDDFLAQRPQEGSA